jgi:antitoxin ParD1/3/4/toxin ParE1/3/4
VKYRLTDTALEDMRQIVRHIRTVQQSPQNARLVSTRLREAFRKLANMPTLGHVRDELQNDTLRVLPVTGLLVIYNPTLKPLTIVRVVHAARDLGGIDPRG